MQPVPTVGVRSSFSIPSSAAHTASQAMEISRSIPLKPKIIVQLIAGAWTIDDFADAGAHCGTVPSPAFWREAEETYVKLELLFGLPYRGADNALPNSTGCKIFH